MSDIHSFPLKLWQTYKDHSALDLAQSYINSWRTLNPEFKYAFLVDDEIDAFMQDNFDDTTIKVFRALPLGVMRADMWRYAVLFIEGGVYADLDAECVTSIKHWPQANNQLLVGLENDTHFCQWCFASNAGNPVLAHVLDLIVERWHEKPDLGASNLTHYLTGPGVWTAAIQRYFDTPDLPAIDTFNTHRLQASDVLLVDQKAFSLSLVRHHFGSSIWHKTEQYDSWVAQSSQLQLTHSCYPIILPGWTISSQATALAINHPCGTTLEINSTASLILGLCDGCHSLAQICTTLSNQFEISTTEMHDSVWPLLNDFARLGVVDLQVFSP